MHLLSKAIILVTLLLCLSSCASVLSRRYYAVNINANPTDTEVKVIDKKGRTIYDGRTPATMSLSASGGYFQKAKYTVHLSKEGYTSKSFIISAKLDGWYIGNLLIGGPIGFLIVDPLTGAMYKLPEHSYHYTLYKRRQPPTVQATLQVINLDEMNPDWEDDIVKLSK